MPLKRFEFLFLCLVPVRLWAGFWSNAWFDPALLQSQDLSGGSGFIHVPAPQSLPDGTAVGAVHGFTVQAGRGFAQGIEAGGSLQLDGWDQHNLVETDSWTPGNAYKENLLYFRWSPLVQGPHCPVGVSVGVEGVGLQDLYVGNYHFKFAPLDSLRGMERQYVVAGGMLPDLPMFYAAAGYGGGDAPSSAFGALAFAPFPGMAGMAEYNEGVTDFGLRMLLSTQIKLDLDLSNVQSIGRGNLVMAYVLANNVTFGISYSEHWP